MRFFLWYQLKPAKHSLASSFLRYVGKFLWNLNYNVTVYYALSVTL